MDALAFAGVDGSGFVVPVQFGGRPTDGVVVRRVVYLGLREGRMTDARDVMRQLRAARPMPRGERLARFCEGLEGRTRFTIPLWDRLLERGGVVGPLDAAYCLQTAVETAASWRAFAEPLRKCREQRQAWREKAKWENRCAALNEVTT